MREGRLGCVVLWCVEIAVLCGDSCGVLYAGCCLQ